MRHVNTDGDAVDVFKVLDKSGGGAVTRDEYGSLSSDEDFDKFDADGNGRLDVREFEALWRAPPEKVYCRNCLNFEEYAKIRLVPTANLGHRFAVDLILISGSCLTLILFNLL